MGGKQLGKRERSYRFSVKESGRYQTWDLEITNTEVRKIMQQHAEKLTQGCERHITRETEKGRKNVTSDSHLESSVVDNRLPIDLVDK